MVVACADARFFTGEDNPNRIDKFVRRSLDSGETCEDYQTVVEEYGEEKNLSSAAIDPVLTYSSDTGRIFMHYCHTPAGVGILNCNSCVGEDAEGNKIISRGFKKYILKNGVLYTKNGKKTGYSVSEDGKVSDGKTDFGSIYTGGKFK